MNMCNRTSNVRNGGAIIRRPRFQELQEVGVLNEGGYIVVGTGRLTANQRSAFLDKERQRYAEWKARQNNNDGAN